MSYSRKGLNSDIYFFHHSEGYFVCCACDLASTRLGSKTFKKMDDAIAHLDEHKKAGHKADFEHIKSRIRATGDQE